MLQVVINQLSFYLLINIFTLFAERRITQEDDINRLINCWCVSKGYYKCHTTITIASFERYISHVNKLPHKQEREW